MKTGTTFLQEVVFPETSLCYLGKNSEVLRNDIGDPFILFKYLQNENPGVPFSELKIPRQLVGYLNHYREITAKHESLLISDELITETFLSFMGSVLKDCKLISYGRSRNLFPSRHLHADT